ncbi:MAG: DNA polymerase III subunit gamma/tau [Victivallaceae bacterium]
MAEYQVIARKWRPQRFADVVGQEHIITTLKNAIRQRRTAHAYLFVGPRGIGKTTTARIFAKALNCESPLDGEPCCKCNSCLSIADESNMDVIEIDAASQNSVDNIRDLRDEVMHVPINSRYKIYIIDEVHMLSKQAWNALLKTVEEPPPHAKFIFATTEVHMVLATIISRCQRFDLQPIPSRMISERLTKIAEAENVRISKEAIGAIARAADGGMRDAQSLLDQMIAFFGSDDNEISEDQVLSLFGLSAAEEIEALISAMLNNDKGGAVAAVYTLACKGKNLETLFSDILNWLRGVQLCFLLSNPEIVLESDPETVSKFKQLGVNVNPEIVQILLENLSPVGRVLHDALNKQVFLETIILKAMRDAHSIKIEQLLARLNSLRKAGDLAFLDKVPSVAALPATPPVKTVIPVVVEAPAVPATPITPPPEPPAKIEKVEIPEPVIEPAPQVEPERCEELPAEPAVELEHLEELPSGAAEECSTSEVAEEYSNDGPETSENDYLAMENLAEEPDLEEVLEPQPEIESTADEIQEADALSAEEQYDEISAEEPVKIDSADPACLWHQLIERIQKVTSIDPMLKSYMSEGTPESYAGSVLTVGFDDEFDNAHFEAITHALPVMYKLLQTLTGDWTSTVSLIHHEGIRSLHQEEASQKNVKKSIIGDTVAFEQVRNKEIVKLAVDLFEGEIVDIHG